MSDVTYEWGMSHNKLDTSRTEWDMSHNKWVHLYLNDQCHMNEACHLWMRHVTDEWGMSHVEWGMSHMNEACHIWMRHVTYEWGMSHMKEACHMFSHVKWGLSHDEDSHHSRRMVCRGITQFQQNGVFAYHVTYEWVMPHMKESWYMDESCYI